MKIDPNRRTFSVDAVDTSADVVELTGSLAACRELEGLLGQDVVVLTRAEYEDWLAVGREVARRWTASKALAAEERDGWIETIRQVSALAAPVPEVLREYESGGIKAVHPRGLDALEALRAAHRPAEGS